MGNQVDNSSPILNDWADTSRWLGICSLLPYLILAIINYLEKRLDTYFFLAEFVLALFCLLWGIILGPVSVIIGIVAIRQIYTSPDVETGARTAVFGIILGITAISVNLLFVYHLIAAIIGT